MQVQALYGLQASARHLEECVSSGGVSKGSSSSKGSGDGKKLEGDGSAASDKAVNTALLQFASDRLQALGLGLSKHRG